MFKNFEEIFDPEKEIEEYHKFTNNRFKDVEDVQYTRTFYVPINILESELDEDDELYAWKKRYESEK